jgi:hypothetical protein
MTRSVAVDVLNVDVCTDHQDRLNNTKVAPYTCNVEWCSKITGSSVNLTTVLYEKLNQINMAFITSNMERSPPITITLVDQSIRKYWILLG